MKINVIIRQIIFAFLILTASCSDMIEYSPFDADIQTLNLNSIHSQRIDSLSLQSDTLTFAVFTDSHFYYDELSAAVSSLNSNKKIAFVIACGDVTDSGLRKEYEYYWKQVKKLRHPIITVIGNHDHLSNGRKIFKRMFGKSNFSFFCNDYKFICFNDIIWENNNSAPDFKWLYKEINEGDQKSIIISHIPPWGDQFTEKMENIYYDNISNSQVILSLHGHEHHFRDTLISNKRYVVTKAVYHHEYCLVHLWDDKIKIEKVNF